MSIYLVSGPPGNGKSYYAVKKAVEHLEEGRIVAGNVQLRPDWPRKVVRWSWPFWFRLFLRRKFLRTAAERYHFSESLEELASIRLKGRGEGRGVMILDEAHNWMNARSWSAADRENIVRLFSQHRKLGWDIYLIAQHPEMIDKQVRNLVEHNIFLRNLKRAKVFGVSVFPVNLFLAIWVWHGTAVRTIEKREAFFLGWRKDLYDTNATSHGLQSGSSEDSFIWLPSPPAERGQEVARTDGRTAPAPPGRPPAPAPGPDLDGAEGGRQEAAEEAQEGEEWEPVADFSRPA